MEPMIESNLASDQMAQANGAQEALKQAAVALWRAAGQYPNYSDILHSAARHCWDKASQIEDSK